MGHVIGRLRFRKETPMKDIIAGCKDWKYRNKGLEERGIHCAEYCIEREVEFESSNVYNSYGEAYDALDELTRGKWYPPIAVLYKEQVGFRESARLKRLKEKEKELHKKLCEYSSNGWKPKVSKANKTISCRFCGSKLALPYFYGHYCPVCKHDMRPRTIVEKEYKLRTQLTETINMVKTLEKEEREKWKKNELYWLIHLEAHC